VTEKSLAKCMAAAAKLLFGLALTWAAVPQPARAQNGLLVSSFQTSEVRLYSPPPPATPTQSIFVTQGLGGLSTPTGLTFDPQGNLYVGNSGFSGAVFEYDKTGAFVKVLVPYGADGQGLLVYPEGLTFGPDGLLYVANNRSVSVTNQACMGDVLRFDGKTGAFIDEFVKCTNNGGLGDPLDLAFGPDGNLYVSSPFVVGGSPNKGAVIRYDGQTGAFKDYFVQPGSGGLNSPWGLVFGPDFKLYVADEDRKSVV
jgi:sugar lactone lactonase YvrE